MQQMRGYSLVEVLVGIAISSALFLLSSSFMSFMSRSYKVYRFRETMGHIATRIERALQNPQNILFSAAIYPSDNFELKNCLFLDQAAGCDAASTDPTQQRSFRLALSTKHLNQIKDLAGTHDAPVRYTAKGRPCGTQATLQQGNRHLDCPIEARAYFYASCGLGKFAVGTRLNQAAGTPHPRACARAATVHVRYQLRHNYLNQDFFTSPVARETHQAHGIPTRQPAIPRDATFWQDGDFDAAIHQPGGSFDLHTGRFQYTQESLPSCGGSSGTYQGPNWTLVGIEQGTGGNPNQAKCECFAPYTRENSVSGSTCVLKGKRHCGPRQRYMGINKSGDAQCQDIACTRWIHTGYAPRVGFDFDCRTAVGTAHAAKQPWLHGIRVQNTPSCRCRVDGSRNDRWIPAAEKWFFRCELECAYEVMCCYEQPHQ